MQVDILWSVIFGAIVVEAIVNIIQNVQERNASWQYWAALAGGVVVGLVVSINYDIDIFKLVGLAGKVPVVGAVLTGLIISRGSNMVSDIVGRLNSWKAKGLPR
jgi:hypothetical protein